MKNSKTTFRNIFKLLTCSFLYSCAVSAQPIPVEARNNIHTLFDQHAAIVRSVELTENGYISLTESEDPKLASVLKTHVRQMRTRLKSGKMVRRWDPAFPEMVMHYQDMEHKIEPTDKGIKVTVTGVTPEAVKVAHNHANIVSAFAKNGWEEHDVRHPVVLTDEVSKTGSEKAPSAPAAACCQKECKQAEPKEAAGACGQRCCKKGGK